MRISQCGRAETWQRHSNQTPFTKRSSTKESHPSTYTRGFTLKIRSKREAPGLQNHKSRERGRKIHTLLNFHAVKNSSPGKFNRLKLIRFERKFSSKSQKNYQKWQFFLKNRLKRIFLRVLHNSSHRGYVSWSDDSIHNLAELVEFTLVNPKSSTAARGSALEINL